jgi:hypothetical protein
MLRTGPENFHRIRPLLQRQRVILERLLGNTYTDRTNGAGECKVENPCHDYKGVMCALIAVRVIWVGWVDAVVGRLVYKLLNASRKGPTR